MLCHEAPALVARRLANPFFRHPDVATYIHYDAGRGDDRRLELKSLLPQDGRYRFIDQPIPCRWGDHTLVEATRLMMASALADEDFKADYFILLSASCIPYRPVASLQAYLRQRPGIDFIQAQDPRQGRWVKDGLECERFEYYFPFNFRTHRPWFEWAVARQREFRIRRRVPKGLTPHFGSQWFCLTRETVAIVTKELLRPDVRRWLRWSWIPDEFAIQTLVSSHRPRSRIAGFNLTYYEFGPRGQPILLENDHLDYLLSQPFFFARKLAPEATALLEALDTRTEQAEGDLGYFDRVGMPTAQHARFLAEVNAKVSLRAHVGTPQDLWRGALETNSRRYYVLRATSAQWLFELLGRARGQTRLPIFDEPFADQVARMAGDGPHRGFAPSDRHKRDHDVAAYLLELILTDSNEPAAFGLDLCRPGRVRDLIRADSRATLVDLDPPLAREQRASMMLAQANRASDAELIQQVIDAMRDGTALPDERFLKSGHPPACQMVALRDLGPELGDATLLALRTAYHSLDPASFHVAAGVAWRQFCK